MYANDIKSAMDSGKASVKSGPYICFNNSVKEDYFLGLLRRTIKQRDRNPSLVDRNVDVHANVETPRIFPFFPPSFTSRFSSSFRIFSF